MREGKSGSERAPDRPWIFRTYAGHSTAAKSNELYRNNLAKGQTGPLDRLRSADPDRLRQRQRARQGRGRQGRRARFPPRRHAHAAGRHPARSDEHVDDDQRHGGVAVVALRRFRRRAGRRARQAHGHHPERHHQGIPVARHLRVPARALAAADQGHDRLLLHATFPSGTRPTSAPTICRRRARRRCRSSPTRWRRQSPCSTWSRPRARCRPTSSARSWGACRSSSTPACGSSPRSARCAPSTSCGRRSRSSATA